MPGSTANPGSPARVPASQAPTLAFFALFLGGVFVLLEGLVLIGAGPNAFGVGYALPTADTSQLGGLGVAAGTGILAVAFFLHENYGRRKAAGVILLILAGTSLACGGGFLIGFALTLGGALLGILRPPTPLYGQAPPGGPPHR